MSDKDRAQFLEVMQNWMQRQSVDAAGSVLVVGGSKFDQDVLERAGFRDITVSNIDEEPGEADARAHQGPIFLDAENLSVPDEAYEIVFAHEVLHHCQSPHRAVCEMLRVARRHVVFMEPNDSAVMRLLERLGLTFPYEIPAVVANDYVKGGVRDSQIPNYIYRWTDPEVRKLVATFLPERNAEVFAYPYWDFNATEEELALRTQTHIATFTRVLGATNFLRLLRLAQRFLNLPPVLRRQGNKFFCHVRITEELQPWLVRENGRIEFDRSYSG